MGYEQKINLGRVKFKFVARVPGTTTPKPPVVITNTSAERPPNETDPANNPITEFLPGQINNNIVRYEINGATFEWVFNKALIQGKYIDGSPWVKGISGLELVSVYPRPEFHAGLTIVRGTNPTDPVAYADIYVNGIVKNPEPTDYYALTGDVGNYTFPYTTSVYAQPIFAKTQAQSGTTAIGGRNAFDSRTFGANNSGRASSSQTVIPGFTGTSYLRGNFDPVLWENNSGKVNANYVTGSSLRLSCTPGDVFVHVSSYFCGPTSNPDAYYSNTNNIPYGYIGVEDSPRKRTAIRAMGVLTIVDEQPDSFSFRPPMVWPKEIKSTRPKFHVEDIIVPDPTGPSQIEREFSYFQGWCGVTVAMFDHVRQEKGSTFGIFSGPIGAFGDPNTYANLMPYSNYVGRQWNPANGETPWQSNRSISTYGTGYAVDVLEDLVKTIHSDAGNISPAGTSAYASILSDRKTLLYRLIQYGIDQWGFYMHNANLSSGAGQRAFLHRPACIAAGYWLGNTGMMNPEKAILEARTNPSHQYWVDRLSLAGWTGWNLVGLTVGSTFYPLPPVGITSAAARFVSCEGWLWNTLVTGGTYYNSLGFPSSYTRTFGCTMDGFTAGYVNSVPGDLTLTTLQNNADKMSNETKLGLTYAKTSLGLLIFGPTGQNHGTTHNPLPGPHYGAHGGKPSHLSFLNLKVISGGGSGPTNYKVLTASPVASGLTSSHGMALSTDNTVGAKIGATASQYWMVLDRPWQNGLPNSTSVISISTWGTGDVGKYTFTIDYGGNDTDTNPSPVSSYKVQHLRQVLPFYTEYLRRLDNRVDNVLDDSGLPLVKAAPALAQFYSQTPHNLPWMLNSAVPERYYWSYMMGTTLGNSADRGTLSNEFSGIKARLLSIPGVSYAIDASSGFTIYPNPQNYEITLRYGQTADFGYSGEGITYKEISWIINSQSAITYGYFLDGSPWVVDNNDLYLESVTPARQQFFVPGKTYSAEPTFPGFTFYGNNTIINPDTGRVRLILFPKPSSTQNLTYPANWSVVAALEQYDGCTGYYSGTGHLVSKAKTLWDGRGGINNNDGGQTTVGRRQFLGLSRMGTEYLELKPRMNSSFTGIVEDGPTLAWDGIRTKLSVGDMVVTARSHVDSAHPYGITEDQPHIDMHGCLTVVSSNPGSSAFRPPVNWNPKDKLNRPILQEVDDLSGYTFSYPNYDLDSNTKTWSGGLTTTGYQGKLGTVRPMYHVSDASTIRHNNSSFDIAERTYAMFGSKQQDRLIALSFDGNINSNLRNQIRRAITQRGIDVYGAYRSQGKRTRSNGGHHHDWDHLLYTAYCVTRDADMLSVINGSRGKTGISGVTIGLNNGDRIGIGSWTDNTISPPLVYPASDVFTNYGASAGGAGSLPPISFYRYDNNVLFEPFNKYHCSYLGSIVKIESTGDVDYLATHNSRWNGLQIESIGTSYGCQTIRIIAPGWGLTAARSLTVASASVETPRTTEINPPYRQWGEIRGSEETYYRLMGSHLYAGTTGTNIDGWSPTFIIPEGTTHGLFNVSPEADGRKGGRWFITDNDGKVYNNFITGMYVRGPLGVGRVIYSHYGTYHNTIESQNPLTVIMDRPVVSSTSDRVDISPFVAEDIVEGRAYFPFTTQRDTMNFGSMGGDMTYNYTIVNNVLSVALWAKALGGRNNLPTPLKTLYDNYKNHFFGWKVGRGQYNAAVSPTYNNSDGLWNALIRQELLGGATAPIDPRWNPPGVTAQLYPITGETGGTTFTWIETTPSPVGVRAYLGGIWNVSNSSGAVTYRTPLVSFNDPVIYNPYGESIVTSGFRCEIKHGAVSSGVTNSDIFSIRSIPIASDLWKGSNLLVPGGGGTWGGISGASGGNVTLYMWSIGANKPIPLELHRQTVSGVNGTQEWKIPASIRGRTGAQYKTFKEVLGYENEGGVPSFWAFWANPPT